jgi:hypothetical protein
MKPEVEKLSQILDSPFGLGFLAHLLGLDANPLLAGTVNAGEISRRAERFSLLDLKRPLFETFADFIIDYPMGMHRDWIFLSRELFNAKEALSSVLARVAPVLVELGFVSAFDEKMQYAVGLQASYLDVTKQTKWQSNGNAWWTTPNTLPTLQGRSSKPTDFAIDDAMMKPKCLTHVSFAVKPKVLEIETAQDWLVLVDAFPIEAKVLYLENWAVDSDSDRNWVWIPNWRQVSEDYSAVYLSPAAYLGVSYRFLHSPDGRETFLSGWSPGATYWLPRIDL